MYDFLKIQYILGNVSKEQLYTYVPTFISEKEYSELLKIKEE